MKPILVLLLLTAARWAHAQDTSAPAAPAPEVEFAPGNVAFVRIVNAIGLRTPTKVSFRTASEPKWSDYQPGETSSMLPVRLGKYRLRVQNEGCEKPEVEDTVSLDAGGVYTLIALYTEPVEKDGKIVHRLQYSKIQRKGGTDGPKLSLVSVVGQDQLPVELNGKALSLPIRQAQHFDVKIGDEVAVRHNGAAVMDRILIMDPIPYLVFL